MNLIVVCVDSLRQDHISFYNPESPVQTPNIDRFAKRSVSFTNVYPEALPTIPIRTQLMTGQRTITNRTWQPLAQTDKTLAELLKKYGYISALISDLYHYFKPGFNYHRGFHVWRWIRGQEYDSYNSAPLRRFKLDDHINDRFPPGWENLVRAVLQNLETVDPSDSESFPTARAVREACEWLEDNNSYDQKFLWIDTFDPHEPWYPPDEFNKYIDPNYKGKQYILPPGGQASNYFTTDEIAHIRGLYAGEVAYVDHYMGQLFEFLEDHGFFDNSMILFISDHGHPLADHGKFLKGMDRLYNELLKVPLLIHFPDDEWGGSKHDALGLFHDVPVTLMDAMGFKSELDAFQGKSLMPVIREEVDGIREAIITGFYEGVDRCIRDKKWSLILRPSGEPNELYDLQSDPKEQNNLIDEYPEEARRLTSLFGEAYDAGQSQRGRVKRVVRDLMKHYEIGGTAISAFPDEPKNQ